MKTPQENQNHSQQNNHEQDGILSENLPFDSAVKSADKNIQERIEELKKGCGKQVDFYQFVCGDNLGTGEYNENGEELYTQNFLCRQCRTELKGIQETLAFVREEIEKELEIEKKLLQKCEDKHFEDIIYARIKKLKELKSKFPANPKDLGVPKTDVFEHEEK